VPEAPQMARQVATTSLKAVCAAVSNCAAEMLARLTVARTTWEAAEEDDVVVTAAGATVILNSVTSARLPPFATKSFFKVSLFVVKQVFRVLAPSAARVLDMVVTWNCTATVPVPVPSYVTMVTSLLVH